MANDVRISISGENLVGAAISGVNASFGQIQQGAVQTNTTLAQTATALAGVEAQGAKLTTTLREGGSSQQIVRTLNELAASGNAAAGQVAPLIAQLQRVEGEGAKASLSIRQVDGEIKGLSVSVREATAATTPWVAAVNQLSGTIPGLSQAMSAYAAASRLAATGNDDATRSTAGLAAGISPLVIGTAAAAAGVGALAIAVHSAIETFAPYQTSLLKVQALTGATAAETARYNERILELARTGPVAAKALADGLYYISSSGFKGAEALDVLNATQKAAAAGFGSFTNVADATTSALKAYHLSSEQAARITDIFAASVIEGKVEANNFAQSIGLVLPIAANLRVPFEQVGAAIATMTNQGLHADEAVTGLKNILGEMLHPTQQGKEALESLGLTVQQLRDILADPSQGLPAMLALLSARTGDNIEVLGKIIPDIRGLNAILALGGVAAGEYADILKKTSDSLGRVDEANKIASQGFEYRLNTLKNRLDDVRIAAGGPLVEVLLALGDHFGSQIPKAADTTISKLDKVATAADTARDALDKLAKQKITEDSGPPRMSEDDLAAYIRSRALPGGGGALTPEQIARLREGVGLDQPRNGPAQVPTDVQEFLNRERAQRSLPTVTPPPPAPAQILTPEQLRANAQAMAQTSTEADKLHNTMVQTFHLPADSNPEVINKRLAELYGHSEELAQAWSKMFDPSRPELAGQRVATLRGLVDTYSQSVLSGSKAEQAAAQANIDSYVREVAIANQRDAESKKTADFEKQRENERRAAIRETERILREAAQADVGTGLAQAMAKGLTGADLKRDLDPAAAKVMDDFMAALEAQGTQSAASAGKTLGTAIVGIAEEMRKSGAGDWQETMARMFDVAESIRRGEPGAVQAFHELTLHASETIDQAKIADAWGRQMVAAEREIRQADQRHTNAMTDAATKRADAMADAQRTEGERVAEAQARQHIDTEMREEQHGLELQRIKERWAREDTDRAEQQARSRQDLADRNSRAMADLQIRAQASETQAQTQMQRARQEAQIQHQERLAEIQRKGGPGMAQAVADENRSFGAQQITAGRQEQYAAQDRAYQMQQQIADATRRQAEATADAAKKQQEAVADLVKSRARQLADRTQAMGDQDTLAAHRLEKERVYHIDAESKAGQRYATQIDQINRRYQHEADTADRTYAQMQRSLVDKLGAGYAELQQRYPWLGDLGAGIALPPQLTPQVKAPTGFFPLGPLEHHAEGGQFMVPGSPGEGDNHLVQFMATPGEQVAIRPVGSVGGGLNPQAPPSNQYSAGTALGATGSFGAQSVAQRPGTDWSTPYTSSTPWGQVGGLPPSVRYSPPPAPSAASAAPSSGGGSGLPEIHLHLDNATLLGDVNAATAKKLADLLTPQIATAMRANLLAGSRA